MLEKLELKRKQKVEKIFFIINIQEIKKLFRVK